MFKRILPFVFSVFLIFTCSQNLFAATPSWKGWVAQLRQEALAQGISPKLFDTVFANMKIGRRQLRLDRTQPERRLTFLEYRKTRIDAYRITLGKRRFRTNKKLFIAVGDKYGVDPCFIASIWGLETSYGSFMGSFSVPRSLATLAYDGRRSAFFRKELLFALHILNQGHISLKNFKGEWAGASGQAQFLPSSWFNYAVDYDGDGRKDIWTNLGDAMASVGNYLQKNGWKAGQPWGFAVNVRGRIPKNMMGWKFKQPLSAWERMGVSAKAGARLPANDLDASLIEPYGGPYFLAFHNLRALRSYNGSTYYVLSVAYLADKICRR